MRAILDQQDGAVTQADRNASDHDVAKCERYRLRRSAALQAANTSRLRLHPRRARGSPPVSTLEAGRPQHRLANISGCCGPRPSRVCRSSSSSPTFGDRLHDYVPEGCRRCDRRSGCEHFGRTRRRKAASHESTVRHLLAVTGWRVAIVVAPLFAVTYPILTCRAVSEIARQGAWLIL